MNLRVGLTAPSAGWEELLIQEGVPYALLTPGSGIPADGFSAVVVTRDPGGTVAAAAIDAYLQAGGAVMGAAPYLQLPGAEAPRVERIPCLLAEPDTPFAAAGLLDVEADGWIPREANHLRTLDNTFSLFAGPWRGGFAVALPFDPARLVFDERAASRNFPSPAERLPAERVSAVGKGALRHLLHASLEFLHHARGVPYAHLWDFPDGRSNAFAFRIDTDGAPRGDVDELYRLARRHGVPLTWFLDVGAHEPWLRYFSGMTGQEFGVHCYEHVALTEEGTARRNLDRARHAMNREGMHPAGTAAPYGTWSPSFAHVVDELGFSYSSEFSYAYDTTPFHPGTADRRYRSLQVPVHPVCIGTLRRVGYSPARMTQYFEAVVRRKEALGEPLFFYHHPSHRQWDVVEALFRSMADRGMETITLGDYAAWWMEREHCRMEIVAGNDGIALSEGKQASGRVWLRLSLPDGRRAVVPRTPSIRFADVDWAPPRRVEVPGDLRRIREFDPRSLLGELFTTLSRKFR